MRKGFTIAVALLPLALLASGAEGSVEVSSYFKQTGRETDFLPRVVNFFIFFGLLAYLLAKPIKEFFVSRRKAIAHKLQEKERLLQEAKEKKVEAQKQLEESKKRAKEILADAELEASVLAKKIEESTQQEIEILIKQFEEQMKLEKIKVVRKTVRGVFKESITPDDIPLDAGRIIDIISKKVA